MNKKNYIDNNEFEALILAYKDNPAENEEELVKMFDLLITNIIGSFNFKIDPDDAKQDCFALILKIIKNFAPRKGTAFNYFTTIIVNNLKLLYTKEKKYRLKIEKFIELQSKKLD